MKVSLYSKQDVSLFAKMVTCKGKDSDVADEPRQKRIERKVSNEDHIH